jgi:hypothetical protein
MILSYAHETVWARPARLSLSHAMTSPPYEMEQSGLPLPRCMDTSSGGIAAAL